MSYGIYKGDSGRIERIHTVVRTPEFELAENEYVAQAFGHIDLNTHFYDVAENVYKDKTDFDFVPSKTTLLADKMDSVELSNLPVGTIIYTYLDNDLMFISNVDDQQFVFKTDMPGNWKFEIDAPPYLLKEIEIGAVSAN